MIPESPDRESGYSVVEVLAAIVILTVAILPMVGMFDVALRATGASGGYTNGLRRNQVGWAWAN